MGWTVAQQNRLQQEKYFIDQLFPAFQVKNPTQNTYWIGTMTTNANRKYQLRIDIPDEYPDQAPHTYIISPNPLYTYSGANLAQISPSHEMHTFTSLNGYPQICLYRSEYWSAEYTLVSCLKKARLWLEAYDEHLDTGKKMCDIVGTLQ